MGYEKNMSLQWYQKFEKKNKKMKKSDWAPLTRVDDSFDRLFYYFQLASPEHFIGCSLDWIGG